MAQLRPKIVRLCHVAGGLTGVVNKIDENAPEYYSLASILTDDEADVAIAAGLRKERTVGYLAKKVGKPVDEVEKLAKHLAWIGVFRCTYDKNRGEDVYFMQIFAPGIMEMLVNNQELLDTHPEVGKAFEEYTRIRMQTMSPLIPNGYGLMRVIPVESAIKDIPNVHDYERLSYYLDKYDKFCVSPCSCRASRSSINDGCGHLAEEMCVQMGKGAEHYIRTGRAREITREEALEIIKRAEDNGLVHELNVTPGYDDTTAICNCCACACFGLRVGLMFGARDAIRSNFVAEVDEAITIAKEAVWLYDKFGEGEYRDIPGLCKVAARDEIEAKGWSLTPGAYVGVAPVEDDGVDFHQRMREIHEELLSLQAQSNELMETISRNMEELGI